jgi:hypothetical protein
MPNQEDIANQQELLAAYRRTLAQYLKQQALISELFTPPAIAHGIEDARDHIRRLKTSLREWGVPVDDLPYDEAPPVAAAPKPAGMHGPKTWRVALPIGGLALLAAIGALVAVLLPNMLAERDVLQSDLYWSQCAVSPVWILPGTISPAADVERARVQIAQAIEAKTVETWQVAGVDAPAGGDAAVLGSQRQLFMTVSGAGSGKVDIHLFNTASVIVTTQPGPQHVDVVNITTISLLSCPSGSGAGTNRRSPPIDLMQLVRQYTEDLQYTQEDYLTLNSEGSEVLVFPFACRGPGIYTIQVGLRYRDNLRSRAGTYLSDKLATIVCPASFTFWPITYAPAANSSSLRQVQLGTPITYHWDGKQYRR